MRLTVIAMGCALGLTATSSAHAQTASKRPAQPAKVKKKKVPRDYQLRLAKKAEVIVGKSASLSLTISAKAGYTISRAGPIMVSLKVKPSKGLTAARRRYRRRHAADKRADDPRFDLRLSGKTLGRYTLAVEARFWACGRRSCRPVRELRKVAVDVVSPPPPPPPATDAGVPVAPATPPASP